MRTCPKCQRDFATNERVCPDDGSLLKDKLSAEEQAIGRILDGKYRIDGFLKRGGMGSVYRGTHVMLNKPVAIKLIRPELVTSNDMVERFFREARAASRLSHPHIVTVHDLGQADDGTLYIIMEIVEGQSLKEAIQQDGPWEPARALRFMRSVASALSLAHRNDIVHRDLKPQNIMVFTDSEGNESPKLLDFGIAKTLEPDGPELTATGMVLGTPHYMSSEQAKGLPADQRSDIYALGVILYEMLVGKVPFDDKSIPSILIKHLTEAPRPPSSLRGNIPRAVEALVLRCLEKDPEKRVQSADELGKTISGLMETGTQAVLDPTIATGVRPEDEPTVATQPNTMAGGAAAAAAFVPPLPSPSAARGTVHRMESGTVRAREVHASATPPPIVVKSSGSRSGLVLFAAIIVGFLAVVAAGVFLVLRLGNRSASDTSAASAAIEVPGLSPIEPETPPPSDADPPEPIAASGTAEAPDEAPPTQTTPAPRRETGPAPTRRADATPPPPVQQPRPEPTPPPAQREEPIPDKPSVLVECEGVKDACGVLRASLREQLDKRGMRPASPMRADVILNVQAEEIDARSETQFGNTFVVRTYSVTIDAEAPRFSDSIPLPPRTFSFDPRLGRDKLRAEAHVIATNAAERVEKYWESKRNR